MTLWVLIKRNVKLFFKDKGLFFTSLATPLILLVLYATFLGNVYEDAFRAGLPIGVTISERLMGGLVGGQLLSSILAVSGVTVGFCSNMLMVQDKANGSIGDLTVAPVRPHVLALSYYVSSLFSTLIICYVAAALCLAYVATVGWYISLTDVLLLLLDVLLLSLFGTALSSVINFFLSTQGQISAVGSIVSSGYGFICGAYMPISQFSDGLQKTVMLLPGTYGTSLVRKHALRGVFTELADMGIPQEAIGGMQSAVDYDLYFFGARVPVGVMYAVLGAAVLLLVGAYVLMHAFLRKKAK